MYLSKRSSDDVFSLFYTVHIYENGIVTVYIKNRYRIQLNYKDVMTIVEDSNVHIITFTCKGFRVHECHVVWCFSSTKQSMPENKDLREKNEGKISTK